MLLNPANQYPSGCCCVFLNHTNKPVLKNIVFKTFWPPFLPCIHFFVDQSITVACVLSQKVCFLYVLSPVSSSSLSAGLLYLVLPNRASSEDSSPLARLSLLLLLTLVHQHARGANPFRDALHRFCEERETKENTSFHVSFDKLYVSLCRQVEVGRRGNVRPCVGKRKSVVMVTSNLRAVPLQRAEERAHNTVGLPATTGQHPVC